MINLLKGLNFKLLFEAAVDAMLLVDDKGAIVVANNPACQMLGYTSEILCGLKVEALMPSRFRQNHHQHRESYTQNPDKRAMGSGRPLVVLRQDGKELEVNIGLSPINTDQQRYNLVTIYEADTLRRAEESFKSSEERLQLAKEAAGLGVFDFDSNQKVMHWDERMREFWGAESEESLIPEKRFASVIHPADRLARQAALEAAINPKGKGEYHAEYRVINPDTKVIRWVSAVGRIHFEDGVAFRLVGVARDITEQKTLEKKLQEQRAEAESISQQMVAAHTASAIAHELNQPLAAISAYSEVALHALQDSTNYSDNLKQALEGCVAQSNRAGRSLHELLDFLQKSDLVTERFDLNDAVKEALNNVRGSGYLEFYPSIHLEKNLPEVLGNRIQVQKILVNLLVNAVEAMCGAKVKNSVITVSVRTKSDTNMAHVSVQDKGPGLDAETAKRVFEPFFTTKKSGIGMGLAISRALTEANGGQLWLDVNTDIGATFHFTLPFAP